MKKSLILLGMLGIGYTYAQSTDPYEGKVGINTEIPSATLNVKSKSGNTSATKNLELQNKDDENLVTVLDDGKVGIGTDSPLSALTIVDNEEDQVRDNLLIRSYAEDSRKANPHIIGHVFGGELKAPKNVVKGSTLVGISGIGHPSSTLVGGMVINASQDYTSTSTPTEILFTTTPKDRTVPFNVMGISSRGNVVIGDVTQTETTDGMTPRATLEINASLINMRADATSNEGLLIPRLSKERVSRMASPLTSTLVWVYSTNYTGTDARVAKIKENGFYYFNGTEWVRLSGNESSSVSSINGTQNETSMECNDANRGKTNFVKDIALSGGGKADAFAVCLKGTDGKFYWRYLYGEGGVSNLEGNFGTGLQ